jgi:hypothetical protein
MSPESPSPSVEQFSALPLHDAILLELRLDWSQRVCVATVQAFVQRDQQAVARQIIWYGMREASIPHHAPWGESQSINAARVEPGSAFVLEMQSGDEIRIVADRFEFR